MRLNGKITSWDSDRGFGYITPGEGGERLFVHINELNNGRGRPQINQSVSYLESTDAKGRPCAEGARLKSKYSLRGITKLFQPVVMACLFLFFLAVAVYLNVIPFFVFILYAVMSLITFIAYTFDKSAARNGQWRSKESTLHLLALAGGWPGAILAQQKLRHKSSKTSFQLLFWLTVVVNLALFYLLCTALGRSQLARVFSFII